MPSGVETGDGSDRSRAQVDVRRGGGRQPHDVHGRKGRDPKAQGEATGGDAHGPVCSGGGSCEERACRPEWQQSRGTSGSRWGGGWRGRGRGENICRWGRAARTVGTPGSTCLAVSSAAARARSRTSSLGRPGSECPPAPRDCCPDAMRYRYRDRRRPGRVEECWRSVATA